MASFGGNASKQDHVSSGNVYRMSRCPLFFPLHTSLTGSLYVSSLLRVRQKRLKGLVGDEEEEGAWLRIYGPGT